MTESNLLDKYHFFNTILYIKSDYSLDLIKGIQMEQGFNYTCSHVNLLNKRQLYKEKDSNYYQDTVEMLYELKNSYLKCEYKGKIMDKN